MKQSIIGMSIKQMEELVDELNNELINRSIKSRNIIGYSKSTTQGLENIKSHFENELNNHTDIELIRICNENIMQIDTELFFLYT